MNITTDNYNFGSSTNIKFNKESTNDAAYKIGFSIIVFVFLAIVSYISYKCHRSSASSAAANSTNTTGGGPDGATTFLNDRELVYSQVKLQKDEESSGSGCSICLADYKETDLLRLLPQCGHFFHLKCINSWLKLHPTCPICRSSPLMPTPLAGVVSLCINQNSS